MLLIFARFIRKVFDGLVVVLEPVPEVVDGFHVKFVWVSMFKRMIVKNYLSEKHFDRLSVTIIFYQRLFYQMRLGLAYFGDGNEHGCHRQLLFLKLKDCL